MAGNGTIQPLNIDPQERLRSIVVAMERERWLNIPRGDRHVWVNLVDFTARIVDFDQVTLETRSVVGARATQTPEFSDVMEYMEINPDWTLPRSIVGRDVGRAVLGRRRASGVGRQAGRVVPREYVDMAAYSPTTLPFEVRQAPGPGNPLGEVKFLFPNPMRSICTTRRRGRCSAIRCAPIRMAASACTIRANLPMRCWRRKSVDPVTYYQPIQRTGRQTQVNLVTPVPVHLVYRTAFTSVTGRMNYRNDIYGRDARLYDALVSAGVEVGA